MVTVSDDDGSGEDGIGDALDHALLGDAPETVVHALVVGAAGQGWSRELAELGETLGQGEDPDGREVGPAGAQEIETIVPGLGHRALVGHDLALARYRELESADDARGLAGSADLVAVAHAVDVEGGLGIGKQDLLGEPVVEPARRRRVTVALGLVTGEID